MKEGKDTNVAYTSLLKQQYAILLDPFFFEVGHNLPSSKALRSSLSHYYARHQLKRLITPWALVEIPTSTQLKTGTILPLQKSTEIIYDKY